MTTDTGPCTTPALEPYEILAPFYDRFTSDHDYELWTSTLEAAARRHGLRGRRLLDLACGTGKSFEPFLARGWDVTACDVSPAMLAEARRRADGRIPLHLADVRDLPGLGRFDLVTCLDEPLNYLFEPDDLVAAFRGSRGCLEDWGLYLFDLNTLHTYRTTFARTAYHEDDHCCFAWLGHASPELEVGDVAEATVEVFAREAGDCWRRHSSRHAQRHHPPVLVCELLEASGLELVALLGQFPDGRLEDELDEDRHTKAVYIARRSA